MEILRIYILLLVFFLVGGIGFYRINRGKSTEILRKAWTKYITYFLIINILFLGIVIRPAVFHYLSLVIIITGYVEITRLFSLSGWSKKGIYLGGLILFTLFSTGFYFFGLRERETMLFTFLIISVFDGFSQISGQLFGKHMLFVKVSPNKTVQGLAGGTLTALVAAVLLKGFLGKTMPETIIIAAGIILFAFIGDFLSSFYKRQYNVKDFGNLIPGHGGFLDRFDSLIAGGSFIALYTLIAV